MADLKIVSGARYRLRSGAIVKVFTNPIESFSWFSPWRGKIEGTSGEQLFWREDGQYGANWRGHELDIVERVK